MAWLSHASKEGEALAKAAFDLGGLVSLALLVLTFDHAPDRKLEVYRFHSVLFAEASALALV